MALALMLAASVLPAGAMATGHVHDASCGYAPASPCDHVHDASCGYSALSASLCPAPLP